MGGDEEAEDIIIYLQTAPAPPDVVHAIPSLVSLIGLGDKDEILV